MTGGASSPMSASATARIRGTSTIRLATTRCLPPLAGVFSGVTDLFGDGTLFAILVPGHTAGSVAYVARTPRGPVLFTGDTSHARWGWEHGVSPGRFSSDRARNAASLAALRGLAARHPALDVRLGHQR